MSHYKVTAVYPHPVEKVWRALVDPEWVPRWTATGRGGRPVGFAPVAGTRFQFVGKPVMGWNGVVECEVLEVQEGRLLRYSWQGGPKDEVTEVTYALEAVAGTTRLTITHVGFRGVGGFFMARILGRVRKEMLEVGLRRLLDERG
jgi:uncharacterized protein YndB with AHSA1/START domain